MVDVKGDTSLQSVKVGLGLGRFRSCSVSQY